MIRRATVIALGALAAAPAAAQPSFDCRRASGGVEAVICANPALSALDRDLATAYLRVGGQPGVAEAQRAWIAQRNRDCARPARETPAACLQRLYGERLAALRPAAPAATVPGEKDALTGNWRPVGGNRTGQLALEPLRDGRWRVRMRVAVQGQPGASCDGDWIAAARPDGALAGRAAGEGGDPIVIRPAGSELAVSAPSDHGYCGPAGDFAGRWAR
ncbi:lysozyme inhibitor LprI family protein [Muricoccus radiodurans]|uniref:lysozyme inhibitor LprI family protein n=1 Tax=Muricoccus radiodurans TaxID=2231721 RepID=UPI003CE84420